MRGSRYAGKLLENDLESATRQTEKYVHIGQNIRGVKVTLYHLLQFSDPKKSYGGHAIRF